MDLLATATGDLAIIDGEIAFVVDQAAIAQHIAFRLRTFLGESRYNRSAGAPWLQVIFRPQTTPISIKLILEQVVVDTPGVTGCTLDDLVIDPDTRNGTISGKAITIAGDVDFSVLIEVTP